MDAHIMAVHLFDEMLHTRGKDNIKGKKNEQGGNYRIRSDCSNRAK